MIWNGDFNWFNTDPATFHSINSTIKDSCEAGASLATSGNVEHEVSSLTEDAGCGCSYPDYVDDVVVDRSNQIIQQLRAAALSTASTHPDLGSFAAINQWLRDLPLFARVQVGASVVGVLHGDPVSLSGWSFAVESMLPVDADLRGSLCLPDDHVYTSVEAVEAWFEQADVDVFACTHTCLPFVQGFADRAGGDTRQKAVINNGSAGMPNFKGVTSGVITRIASTPIPDTACGERLYGLIVNDVHVDAVSLPFDSIAWERQFTRLHPLGSPAYLSYHRRIRDGPNFATTQADRTAVVLG